jgi:hypothetical protein
VSSILSGENQQSVTAHNTTDVGLLLPVSRTQNDIRALLVPLTARLLCLLNGFLLKLKLTIPRSTLKSIVSCDLVTVTSYKEVKRKF